VVPPKFRYYYLHSANTGYPVKISDIAFLLTVETPLKPTKIILTDISFRFTAQRLLPCFRHEDLHQPSSLYASGEHVLLLVNAILFVFGFSWFNNILLYSKSQ